MDTKLAVMPCDTCGVDVQQAKGSGRIKRYCQRGCYPSYLARGNLAPPPTCIACGNKMRRDTGHDRCYGCRQQREPELHQCRVCRRMFETTKRKQVYCSPDCSPHTNVSSTQRGYGVDHVRMRRQWAAFVSTGAAECSLCGEAIDPTRPWHLDHTDDRQGYRGVACASCNIRDGAIKGNRSPKRTLKSSDALDFLTEKSAC